MGTAPPDTASPPPQLPEHEQPQGPSRSAIIAGTIIVTATIVAYVILERAGGNTIQLLTFIAPLAAALFIVKYADNLRSAVLDARKGQHEVRRAVDANTEQAADARTLFETNGRRIDALTAAVNERWAAGQQRIDELTKAVEGLTALHEQDAGEAGRLNKLALDVERLSSQVISLSGQVTVLTTLMT